MELPENRVKVGVYISMVVLDIRDRERTRSIVEELCPLIEKSRIVLIRLDHKKLRIPEPSRYTEITRHPADQKTRRVVSVVEDLREHATGSCLTVSPSNRQYPLVLQNIAEEPLRTRIIRKA